MKLKRLSALGSAMVLSFSTLLAIGFSGVAHATSSTYYKWTGGASATHGLNGCTLNCWSVYGNWDISTDGGNTYGAATAGETPNNTDNSGAGDNIVFDSSIISSATVLTDDISGLIVDTMNEIGTPGSNGDTYSITGQALTVTGGLTTVEDDNAQNITLSNDINFTGSTTFGQSPSNGSSNFSLYSSPDVTVVSGTLTDYWGFDATLLTVDPGATYLEYGGGATSTLNGSGNVIISTPGSGRNYANSMDLQYTSGDSFSGNITVQPGAELDFSNPLALGTATITIDSGGQMDVDTYNYQAGAGSSNAITIPNTITLGGDGGGVLDQTQGAIIGSYQYDNSSNKNVYGSLAVTLSGPVNLTSNTEFSSQYSSNVTYNLTGTYTPGSYTLTAVVASAPEYGTTTIEVNGSAINAPKAPKAPDTGASLVSEHVSLPLIGSLMIAGSIFFISRKVKHPIAIKRR